MMMMWWLAVLVSGRGTIEHPTMRYRKIGWRVASRRTAGSRTHPGGFLYFHGV